MSPAIRILLVVASVLSFWYVARKLKKSQIRLMDTVFWILLSVCFVVLAIWPQIAIAAASALGIISSVNFIFLVIIFLLLVRCFLMDVRTSQLEERLRSLTEEIAIRENKRLKDEENENEDEKEE